MKFHNMATVANKILIEFRKLVKNLKGEVLIYTYHNGRENGYCLQFCHPGCDFNISFSENRNSDDIVVYFNEGFSCGVLSNESYVNRKFFKHGDYKGAATYVLLMALKNDPALAVQASNPMVQVR